MLPVARSLLLALLLLGPSARAVEPLDARRDQVGAVREALARVEAERQARRDELAAVARRVETLKAASRGRLLPGGELDGALKRSQELSAVVTGLARQVAGREAELEAARLALLEALGAELSRVRDDFDRQPSREVRASLIGRLRQLRSEREAVRATLPPARVPTLGALRASDDPEELLEQADQLRDGQEKAHRERAALEGLLAERRQEAALDRRVQRFLGEESMFDDQDRRLRVQRVEAAGQRSSDSAGGLGGPLGFGAGTATPAANGPDTAGLPGGAQVVKAADARPQPGAALGLPGEDEDLAALERQRAALERLEQDLARRADELQRRAAELK